MSESSRLRSLSWLTALVLALLGSLQACDCGSTGADVRRFACAQDDECASGFVCRLGECQPEEEPDGGVPDGGEPDGGGTDGGPDAGPTDGGPTGSNKLALVTAPLTLQAGRCSAGVIVETQDPLGNAINAGARTTINLTAAPSTGFNFYSDSLCALPISNLTLQANRSRVTFYVRGTTAQSVQITASATNWLPASQTETIIPGPPTVLAFLTSSQTLPAGGCSAAVDFETRDSSGNVSPVTTQTRVGLTALASAGILFSTGSGCDTPATEVVLAQGTSRGRFYFKGRTGGTFSLSASASGFSTASQSETILPVVRTGTCTLPSGDSSVTCSISPPQLDRTKALLLFQASSNGNTPNSSSVRCSLSALDAITCSRNGNGASDPAIRIQWQTAELISGITVQHLQAACGGTPITELPIQPVSSLQNAFLLVSSEKNGVTQGDDDYYVASLFQGDAGFHVDLQFSVNCVASWRASVQVVELEGADVTRGLTGSMMGNQLVVSNLPAVDPASTMLLFTYRTSGASGPAICDRVLRGELTSPTSITFSRGAGAEGCTAATIDSISWERIEFSGGVSAQHLLVSMDAGVQTTTVPIMAVDTTRTLVFATGQMQSGQAGGETSYAGDDVIGTSLGWHTLTSPTTLEVTRGYDGGVAQWNSTVLQIDP
jgi:hypothetical protein